MTKVTDAPPATSMDTRATVLAFQSAGVNGTEFYTPEADCFAANRDASFSEQVLNITMAVSTRLRLKR